MKKLYSLLHSWRMNSNVSKNVKQKWCTFDDDDEKIIRENIIENSYHLEDDIDIRAEIFIAKFRRQLSLERRIFA